MSTAGSIVLHRIISGDPAALDSWTRLSPEYFTPDLRVIYKAIFKFYNEYNKLPNLAELELYTRNAQTQDALVLLMSSNPPEEAALDIATNILIDEHVQGLALEGIEKFVNKITAYNSEEIVQGISEIAYEIENQVKTKSNIYTLDELSLFEEEKNKVFIPLGLNNTMDAQITGVMRGELMLIGGQRGNGKSLVCANVCVNEYLQGYIAPYYTIEMRASQIYRRLAAIEAEVDAMRLRSGIPNDDEKLKLARALIKKYDVDQQQVFDEFRSQNLNLVWLQNHLRASGTYRQDNQMIIVDNPQLSLADIDSSLMKLKARHGDKIRMVIVDYLNQISPSMTVQDKFDWKEQITIASTLKAFAQKHDVIMIVPYQIDSNGEARFSKGILDSPDYAMVLKAHKDADNPRMEFATTKARDVPPFSVCSKINWETLKISPEDAPNSSPQEEKPSDESFGAKSQKIVDIATSTTPGDGGQFF